MVGMMDPVAFIPRDTYPQIAGAASLDLVNTVSWRLSGERRIEHLVDYSDLLRWCAQVGFIDAASQVSLERQAQADPAAAADERHRVLHLREALYEVAYEHGSADPIALEYADAVAAGHLDRDLDAEAWTWRFPDDLALPRRRIALAAVDLLSRGDVDRLGQCSDAECGWVFLDTSPRHNRRWCVAADCGNRNRVREHYARTRGAAAGAAELSASSESSAAPERVDASR